MTICFPNDTFLAIAYGDARASGNPPARKTSVEAISSTLMVVYLGPRPRADETPRQLTAQGRPRKDMCRGPANAGGKLKVQHNEVQNYDGCAKCHDRGKPRGHSHAETFVNNIGDRYMCIPVNRTWAQMGPVPMSAGALGLPLLWPK
jgi:hypothetical protein